MFDYWGENMTKLNWNDASFAKSIHSAGGNCVEVAALSGVIGVRDSKQGNSGPVLEFTPSEWAAFTAGVRDGEFD
jgi:hypothetical protein